MESLVMVRILDYKVQKNICRITRKAWLDAHPDFNYEQDIEDAKVIARGSEG